MNTELKTVWLALNRSLIFDTLKYTLVLLSILFLVRCSTPNQMGANSSPWPDINGFVTAEISWLTNNNVVLIKRSSWQDKMESDTLNKANWKEEMYPFLELTIKPTIWKTDFKLVDSTVLENQTLKTFQTTNPRQRIKSITLVSDHKNGELKRLEAQLEDHNKLTTSTQRISITHHVGYSIAGKRDTKVIGDEDYQLVGRYYKNEKDI